MVNGKKYLHAYKTKSMHDSDYRGIAYDAPWVGYTISTEEVSFNIRQIERYLTFTALESGTFTMTLEEKVSTQCVESISYSLDNGETWTTTNNVNNQAVTVTTPTVAQGDKVLWKGTAVQYCTNPDGYPGSNLGYGYFTSTGTFNAEGNIMSILYGDNFIGNNTLPTLITSGTYAGTFSSLFGKNNCKIVSAGNLTLPATTLARDCYLNMFEGCTLLTTPPPVLPATTLADYCYQAMFEGCTSLTTAPVLSATTLANSCCNTMFYGCASLTMAPALPATTLNSNCYQNMFYGCASLTMAPALPATTLASSCYNNMFYGCTSLTTAPALPATTLADSCYYRMFYGCTGLTAAPELPATTLNGNCYLSMFNGCTSLTTAPALPATTLADFCYAYMFYGCTSLTTAPVLNATRLATSCYNNMFYGCTRLTSAPSLPATTLAQFCYSDMFKSCTSLTTAPSLPALTMQMGCYAEMFYGCSSLTAAPELPATSLANDCYTTMFYGCRSLTAAPELPATTLVNGCYSYMFYGCSSLTTAPELPATTLVNGCYSYMFSGCARLNYIKALFTTAPSTTYTQNWVQNVAASGTFVKSTAAQWNVTGVNGVPSGWTVETDAREALLSMWVDDYPGRVQMNYALEDPDSSGANPYILTGNTVTYNGQTCYVWEDDLGAGQPEFLLTSTNNYNTLRNQSIEVSGYGAQFTSLVAFTEGTTTTPYGGNDTKVPETKLISITNDGGTLYMYIDDFGPVPTSADIADPETAGANYYEYYGDTMTYQYQQCYVWEDPYEESGQPKYILTTTAVYSTLLEQSMANSGLDTDFTAFVAALGSDSTVRYTKQSDWGEALQLIKVESPRTPLMGLWIDDYPEDSPGSGELDGDPIEDVMDRAISNPANSGANFYVYYGDTMEFDGDDYYVWELEKVGDQDATDYTNIKYLLTSTDNISTLEDESMEINGYDAEFTSLVARCSEDQSYVTDDGGSSGQKLILVFEY